MQLIDNNTVAVETSDELKEAVNGDNTYTYIYLLKDITLTSGFSVNSSKEQITIDGTYQGSKHTYTNYLTESTDVISAVNTNKKIIIKNMNIISSHTYGVIYVQSHPNFSNLVVEYDNITFTGVTLSCNYYGTTKINNSTIEIKDTNNITAKRACDCNNIVLDGTVSITSYATSSTVIFLNDVISSSLKIAPDSNVTITTNKELMNGTNKLNLTVGHGSVFLLTTGNGFAATTTHGARNVLVEEMASFTFIEKSHQRVPMWNIFGNFTIKEGASVSVLNTYMSTPTDNYNIYFKGSNQTFILDNPKYVNIYTKNANTIYTNNQVTFSFKFSRINMWIDALDFTNCCTLDDMPILYWYKDNYLAEIKGTFTKDTTTVTSHNFTADELSLLPDISNFSFQSRKIITIGMVKTNIHPVNNYSNILSGHTIKDSEIKVEYLDKKVTATADSDGLFECDLDDAISDDTLIKVTSCLAGCYTERKITAPFTGELTLLSVTDNIPFDLTPIEKKPLILPKKNNIVITIVDSRVAKTNWKLYTNFTNPMIEKGGSVLIDSLLFKKFDDEVTSLTTTKKLIYQTESTSTDVEVSKVTYSTDKGLLLSPTNNLLINNDYSTMVVWSLEE